MAKIKRCSRCHHMAILYGSLCDQCNRDINEEEKKEEYIISLDGYDD